MRGTAFVVSTADPVGVIPVDIDSDPMRLSGDFEPFLAQEGSGIPAKLLVTAIDRAYLLTSNAVILFDPRTGSMRDFTSAVMPIDVGAGLQNSDGTPSAEVITPSYPGGIAIHGGLLFVSSANFISTQAPAVCAPGTVQVFEIDTDGSTERAGHIVTSGYNPTGLAVRGDELIVVNSGVIDIVDSQGVARTDAGVDVVDIGTLDVVTNIGLGLVAASHHAPALTLDGSRAFIGSAAYGEVYEVDLINRQVLRGDSDPIVVTQGQDFISSVALSVDDRDLYAASFERSAVYPFFMGGGDPLVGDPFEIGFPAGVTDENPSGANTGAGALAVRPGSRDVDYDGADLYALTGYPGSLVAIDTGAPAQEYAGPDDGDVADDLDVPDPPVGSDGEACQGYAQAVESVSYGAGAGFGQASLPEVVMGPPSGAGDLTGSLHVVSLGHDGSITLDLGNCPAVDGPGDDFIVFENAFLIGGDPDAPYAELGTVEVSADGFAFFAFACDTSTYPYDGCAGWRPVYSHPDNGIDPFDTTAAGGESFDLADVGLAKAKYIRITDAGTTTASGTTAGFDLDATAVINGEIEN